MWRSEKMLNILYRGLDALPEDMLRHISTYTETRGNVYISYNLKSFDGRMRRDIGNIIRGLYGLPERAERDELPNFEWGADEPNVVALLVITICKYNEMSNPYQNNMNPHITGWPHDKFALMLDDIQSLTNCEMLVPLSLRRTVDGPKIMQWNNHTKPENLKFKWYFDIDGDDEQHKILVPVEEKQSRYLHSTPQSRRQTRVHYTKDLLKTNNLVDAWAKTQTWTNFDYSRVIEFGNKEWKNRYGYDNPLTPDAGWWLMCTSRLP